MKVLCTGPESSGTRLLTRIVSSGAYAMHRSMPHEGVWWTGDKLDCDAIVAIHRTREATVASALAARHVRSRAQGIANRDRAINEIDALEPHPFWVSYEHLIADPLTVIYLVSQRLGVRLTIYEEIRNENSKWALPSD